MIDGRRLVELDDNHWPSVLLQQRIYALDDWSELQIRALPGLEEARDHRLTPLAIAKTGLLHIWIDPYIDRNVGFWDKLQSAQEYCLVYGSTEY
jgi:hypothetical protein